MEKIDLQNTSNTAEFTKIEKPVSKENLSEDFKNISYSKEEKQAEFSSETTEEKKNNISSIKSKILRAFGRSPEQISNKILQKAEDRLNTNHALKQAYEKILQEEGEGRAQEYKEALGKWTYIGRDEEGNFVDRTVYSVASGEASDSGA